MMGVEHSFIIRKDDLSGPEIAGLLETHLDEAAKHSPPESTHALDINSLRKAEITFWTAWQADQLLGCGALKALDAEHGEIKSMHTAKSHRGKGVAKAILETIITEARLRNYQRLSLETGTPDAFAPARTLYAGYGFTPCEPFGQYRLDPFSLYLQLDLN